MLQNFCVWFAYVSVNVRIADVTFFHVTSCDAYIQLTIFCNARGGIYDSRAELWGKDATPPAPGTVAV